MWTCESYAMSIHLINDVGMGGGRWVSVSNRQAPGKYDSFADTTILRKSKAIKN